MTSVLNKLYRAYKSIGRSSEGSILPIFALSAIAMMLVVGFTVDFRRVENSKSRMQDAADAAVLAAAREYLSLNTADMTVAERKTAAIARGQAYFNANLAANESMLTNAAIDIQFTNDFGDVTATVNGDLGMVFAGLAGIESQDIEVQAAASAGDTRKLEIVLALDNSTSMFYNNRMNLMRDAAKNFTDIVFDGAAGPNAVQIGVVPWAASVNILSEAPQGWNNAAGSTDTVDAGGSRAIPGTPSDDRLTYLYRAGGYTGSYTADELDAAFAPVGWRGCIAATQNERQVNGLGEVTQSLTDAPPSPMRWPALLVGGAMREQYVDTSSWSSANVGCKNYDFYDFEGECGAPEYEPPTTPTCKNGNCYIPHCSQYYTSSHLNFFVPADLSCTTSSSSVSTGTLQACIADPNEHAWVEAVEDGEEVAQICPGITLSSWDGTDAINDDVMGPNINCPSPMLPMSQSRPQVYDKLNHIFPVWEATHADLGLMWAYRMLSDNSDWTDFWGYTEDTTPQSFESGAVRKMVVLLSDGKNTSPNWYDGYYGCNMNRDYGLNDCGKATGMSSISETAMDNLTLDACDALKDDNVEVFTIALDLDSNDSEESDAIDLLAECATNDAHAYNITTSELDQTFEEIAQSALRLTR